MFRLFVKTYIKNFQTQKKNFPNIPGDIHGRWMEVSLELVVHYWSDIAAPAMSRVAGTVAGTVGSGCP